MAQTIEHFVIESGQAVPLPTTLETGEGKYKPPTGGEVVEIPPAKPWRWFKPRKIALYPAQSPRPFPLALPGQLDPSAYRAADVKNLEGDFMATLLRRTLGIDLDKLRLKDWLILILVSANLLATAFISWVVYQIGARINLF